MKLTSLIFCLLALAITTDASEVLVKQITIAVPFTDNVRFRECKYFVDEAAVSKLPRFDPESTESSLAVTKALGIAFDSHFGKHGVPRAQFYREVQITLEKVNDYSASAVANGVRKANAEFRNLWFYVVSCGQPKFGESKLGPPPILILMDGSVLTPKEQLKGLPK